MSTVYLVDDDESVRRALTRMLSEEGLEVHGYESAEAFLASYQAAMRGCLILDVSMPGIDGLELQARLRAAGASLSIVFLTGHGDVPMTVRALKRGAADFLLKPVPADALIVAVREALIQNEAAHRHESERAEIARSFATLSTREREVLTLLVKGKINKQIADELGVVEQTVKFHRARIMRRMRARTVAELMHMTARLGVCAGVEPHPALDRPQGIGV